MDHAQEKRPHLMCARFTGACGAMIQFQNKCSVSTPVNVDAQPFITNAVTWVLDFSTTEGEATISIRTVRTRSSTDHFVRISDIATTTCHPRGARTCTLTPVYPNCASGLQWWWPGGGCVRFRHAVIQNSQGHPHMGRRHTTNFTSRRKVHASSNKLRRPSLTNDSDSANQKCRAASARPQIAHCVPNSSRLVKERFPFQLPTIEVHNLCITQLQDHVQRCYPCQQQVGASRRYQYVPDDPLL